jgi:hypothetical protein
VARPDGVLMICFDRPDVHPAGVDCVSVFEERRYWIPLVVSSDARDA